jgi:5'-phosphate synthase pdxT subunit
MASFSSSAAGSPAVGLLACQGGFEAHRRAFAAIGVGAREVRNASEIDAVDALVLPGGESTTVMKAIERDGLATPIAEFVSSSRPVLGTCAGAIVLDRDHLGLLDIACERNAYGRQIASFEAEVAIDGCGEDPFRCVFIRAPKIRVAGAGLDVLARYGGDAVLVREGNILAATFHPELAGDERLHAMFTAMIGSRAQVGETA